MTKLYYFKMEDETCECDHISRFRNIFREHSSARSATTAVAGAARKCSFRPRKNITAGSVTFNLAQVLLNL